MIVAPDFKLGANSLEGGGYSFLVWAPRARRVDLHLLSPVEQLIPMEAGENGYFQATVKNVEPGALYFYRLDGEVERPDPASRLQPQGVHGPTEIVNPWFAWGDEAWRGIELRNYVFYELHTGTFTSEGTFDAIIPRLAKLKDLGITAIELMPVAQFPGERNWGYDGVFPFAAQESYGGPQGLKRLVNACHLYDLAVVLDVVYNHIGPEGNYFAQFGPYFTDFYHTPWGEAINFDREHSDEVRRYFIENALYWTGECHIDALRLDAVHAITDTSAQPFLGELAVAVHGEAKRISRKIHLIAESNQNDARLVTSDKVCGYQLDAQWNDDFHHAVHTLLTEERDGYYADFGGVGQLARAFSEGFVYSGQHSKYRGRRHGSSSCTIPAEKFIVFAQNHDQVGNRRLGDRLNAIVSFEALKLAAGLVALSPYLPLIFMGEEYGEPAPFLYFVSHGDPSLIEAVRKGRREEFSRFEWQGELPDPQDVETFRCSRINWELRNLTPHKHLLALHKELLRLRGENPVLSQGGKRNLEAHALETPKALVLHRWRNSQELMAFFYFENTAGVVSFPAPAGRWAKVLDSTDLKWAGPGSDTPATFESHGEVSLTLPSWSFALYGKSSA